MSCGSCGSGSGNGKPAGCQSNGGCSSGGCNRMNVFNWLAEMPLSDLGKPYPIIEVSFNQGSRKDFYRNNTSWQFDKGTLVTVEGVGGFDVGQISLTGELVKLQMKKHGIKEDNPDIKKILRPAGEQDILQYEFAKSREREIMIQSRVIAKSLNLDMKIAEAELQADGKKVTFFYTADTRVDFRELIKIFAVEFRAKIEMKQIGSRQESAKVGGIGSCGRELCCSSWLTDFKTVNTTAARYQNLSINQAKLSGQCGRLKCCLNYELDTYMDALKIFPVNAEVIEITNNKAFLQKKDIFRNLMWYSFSGSARQYPLTIERVEEIIEMNKRGEKPDELESVEIQSKNKSVGKSIDIGFVNDVGQLTLSSLTKAEKRSKKKRQGKLAKTEEKIQPNTLKVAPPPAKATRSNEPHPKKQPPLPGNVNKNKQSKNFRDTRGKPKDKKGNT